MSMNFTIICKVYEAAGVSGVFVPSRSAPVDR
jgi:hypothetical protein